MAIIARKDLGISSSDDLKGTKIGVTTGTNMVFFMDSLLLVHGMAKKEIEVVALKPEEIFDALGRVAAVSAWNPYLIRLQKELAGRELTFYGGL